MMLEIMLGKRFQATKKIWGSVAHALKAVAKDRGWPSNNDDGLTISKQLGRETGKEEEFTNHFYSALMIHHGYYDYLYDWDQIARAQRDAKVFVDELNAIRDRQPGTFTIETPEDQGRLAILLGIPRNRNDDKTLDKLLPIGTVSEEGFAPNYGYRTPNNRSDNDDDGMAGAAGAEGQPEARRPSGPGQQGALSSRLKSLQGHVGGAKHRAEASLPAGLVTRRKV